jgi:hypothetical protein
MLMMFPLESLAKSWGAEMCGLLMSPLVPELQDVHLASAREPAGSRASPSGRMLRHRGKKWPVPPVKVKRR